MSAYSAGRITRRGSQQHRIASRKAEVFGASAMCSFLLMLCCVLFVHVHLLLDLRQVSYECHVSVMHHTTNYRIHCT